MAELKKSKLYSLKSSDRSIGAILVDSGKLTLDEADRILQLQREENLRFGDAAIKLGYLTEGDLQFALARQFDYPYLLKGDSSIDEELVAAYQPFSHQSESLRALRSQLLLRCFVREDERKALAILSPGRSEGRSYIAANLAVVFSQLGTRTLLIDADMRNPRQHKLFNLDNRTGLSSVLAERGSVETVKRVPSLLDLSVLTAGPTPPNPLELLGRSLFSKFVEELSAEFDVIIIDTPACSEFADAQTVATCAGSALMIARKNHTQIGLIGEQADVFMQSGVQVVGTMLNDY